MKRIEAISGYISKWLKDYLRESGQRGYVIGISGGIDSAVTSILCARSGVPTACLSMPIHQNQDEYKHAQNHISFLKETYGCRSVEVDLTNIFNMFSTKMEESLDCPGESLTLANSRSRLRMVTLYHYAGLNKYLVAGTGNKIEDFGVGFFTKYGDGGVDLSPIADLYKSEVYKLGEFLGVSKEIMEAPPTDGLFENSPTDEEQIGATYNELEWAMKYGSEKGNEEALVPRQREVLTIYQKRNRQNQHKMYCPPVCKIPPDLRG